MAIDTVTGDARLTILRELAQQTDARSNEVVLDRVLDASGFRRSRDWLRTQLRALAELDAVLIETVAGVMVVTLRRAGRDHVDRRSVIEGVSRPADQD